LPQELNPAGGAKGGRQAWLTSSEWAISRVEKQVKQVLLKLLSQKTSKRERYC
jgi:hypothetical protein